jgi:polyisoprenoid-binding protein YceI
VGRLIIAGTARDIDLKLSVQAEGQHLVIWARTSLKMTDFNVEPPTAMLGMIRSGDTVRVDVSWQLMARPPQARSSQARSPQARS